MVESCVTGSDSPSRLPRQVFQLGWVSFLTDVSSEMIYPLLPVFLASLPGTAALALGWIEGVAETTAASLKVVSGRITDRMSRKKPLVVAGYGISSVVRPLIALATSWHAVLALRFVDRAGKGIRSAPRDTIIASVTPPGRRGEAYGVHRAFDNAGAVLGPLLATLLVGALAVPVRGVFALAAIPAALAVAVLVLGVKEGTPRGAAPEPVPAKAPEGPAPPLPPAFWRTAAVITAFTLSASSDTFILLRARDLGTPAALVPALWAFSNAVRAGFSRWGGRLSDRAGRRRVLLAGWLLYAGCYGAFAAVRSAWALAAVLGVYSLHAALTEGTERALVADLVPAVSRGRAFGWLHGMTGLAALPASAGFGWFWLRFGAPTAFAAGGGLAALAALGLVLLVPRTVPPGGGGVK